MLDKAKLVAAVLLITLGVWGYYWLAEHALILRVLSVIGGVLAGAAVAWFSAPGREFALFAGESIAEVKKVVWPTRKETMQTTAIVFVFVVVMALFLFAVDTTLQWIIKLLTGRTDG